MDSSSSDESSGSDGYHTNLQQTEELELMFQVCPRPNRAQRMQLSMNLGMLPSQVKYWFQSRRIQMQIQVERDRNIALRAEADRLWAQYVAAQEASRINGCINCAPTPERQMLLRENALLKEKLELLKKATTKLVGSPVTRLPPVQASPISPLDVPQGDSRSSRRSDSVGLSVLSRSSSVMSFPSPIEVSEDHKQILLGIATIAMEELIKLVQANEPFWINIGDAKEVLNLDAYDMIFPGKCQRFERQDNFIETSRSTDLVMADAMTLVDMFMDSGKWVELFPTIVAQARTLEVLSTGITENKSGTVLLMYEELHVLSPVVPTRKFCFLRFCEKIDLGLWMIVDVSVNFPKGNQLGFPSVSRKFPSGCLIKDLSNGYSMITWVEHVEIEAKKPMHHIYRDLLHTGNSFGAQRWLSALQRMCERQACLRTTEISPGDFGAVITSLECKGRLMNLAQRMLNNFCTSLSVFDCHQWITLLGSNDVGVRVSFHKNHHHDVVISAATSVSVPLPSHKVFNFFRDQSTRSQWDIPLGDNPLQEVTHISNGSIAGNTISLFKVTNYKGKDLFILQETCTDDWGSILVYSHLNLPSLNDVISSDPSSIPLFPSGFSILPYGTENKGGASTSSNLMGGSSGSVVTASFQIAVSSLPSSILNQESLMSINRLISNTVQRIKDELNCLPMA